ncbi:lipocalin-like domain-containing protein [Variovorax sp. HJSM1_2]|uniref:lipocalin-like domain-containing protein n=1 Tax=Variovorax sp. HJSM1_2 TaxID=3366263 RepID=UPI003BE33DE2
MLRRHLLGTASALALWPGLGHGLPPAQLRFPRDHGSHPDFQTEWWYITGHATSGGRQFGFQLTFFRSRVASTQAMSSHFAAKQLLLAHAAITDVQGQKLWHDQRLARAGFAVAEASESDTSLRLLDWSLQREPGPPALFTAHLPAADFSLDLRLSATQPPLLQGQQGLSRKGPQAEQASYYVSQPQLAVAGTLSLQGRSFKIDAGRAWLDHEWSQAVLHPQAVGWDWIGMNLDNGDALTAFHLRRADGSALWAGGSYRSAEGKLQVFASEAVRFTPGRIWLSPHSQGRYPVEWRVQTPAGTFAVHAVVDAQELDSRASTGTQYWEGLSTLSDAAGRRLGLGYLEMTGYVGRLRL